MKLLLCLTCLISFTGTNAKKIKIQIEPDDIVKIMDGVMHSDTFKNFASQLAQRTVAKQIGYNNPYHPEDDLVKTFNDAVDKEKDNFETKIRQSVPLNDPLDEENDNFIIGNDVVSNDELTENEHGSLIVVKATNNDTTIKPVEKKPKSLIEPKTILTRKDSNQLFNDDRANFKPVQTRFVLKSSNDENRRD